MHTPEHIFCLKCSASTEDETFCKCGKPDMYNWMIPSADIRDLAVLKNWGIVQLQDSPADVTHDEKL